MRQRDRLQLPDDDLLGHVPSCAGRYHRLRLVPGSSSWIVGVVTVVIYGCDRCASGAGSRWRCSSRRGPARNLPAGGAEHQRGQEVEPAPVSVQYPVPSGIGASSCSSSSSSAAGRTDRSAVDQPVGNQAFGRSADEGGADDVGRLAPSEPSESSFSMARGRVRAAARRTEICAGRSVALETGDMLPEA